MAGLEDIILDGTTDLDNQENQNGQQNGDAQNGQQNSDKPKDQPDDTGNQGGNSGDNQTGEELVKELTETFDIKVGDKFEVEGDGVLSLDENGNLINENGEIFKEAKDVKEYLESHATSEDDFNTLEGLKSFLEYEPIGDDNKPIEFSDTPEGRKAYIDNVMLAVKAEAKDEAINELFENEPEVANFYNFIKSGGDPKNYRLEQDRSNIEFDANDVEKQKDIIRQLWNENGNAGSPEDYISYLEAGGSLADAAKKALDALKEKDVTRKQELEQQRIAKEKAYKENQDRFVKTVMDYVSNGEFDGCKIPDNITLDRNGKKITYSKQDFIKYLFQPGADGVTQYVKDKNAIDSETYTKRLLLDAWITFTGGSYKDIVNMAIKDNEVKKLRLIAKKATQTTGKPIYQQKGKSSNAISDILL